MGAWSTRRPCGFCMSKLIGMRLQLAALLLAPWLAAGAAPTHSFDWFEYTGKDAVFDSPLPAGSYRNPILAGFYPDPERHSRRRQVLSGELDVRLFPGIPVFESSDLVHWRLLGHVLDRPSQLRFDGLDISRGVFAPAIHHHDGVFYVLNTLVDSGGNFISTAKNPAGPWSDPVWLPEIDGIDPSLFVDADGKAYVLNNGAAARAAEIRRPSCDLDAGIRSAAAEARRSAPGVVERRRGYFQTTCLDRGAASIRRGAWYYLMCAEGGTSVNHSEVILRSQSVWGPYVPYENNPILTQRDLPKDRANPIVNAGHADLVEAPDGTWWATFLGSRPYDGVNYHTGRETYLLPVTWKNDWPVILQQGKASSLRRDRAEVGRCQSRCRRH